MGSSARCEFFREKGRVLARVWLGALSLAGIHHVFLHRIAGTDEHVAALVGPHDAALGAKCPCRTAEGFAMSSWAAAQTAVPCHTQGWVYSSGSKHSHVTVSAQIEPPTR